MISFFNDYFHNLFSEYWLNNTNTFRGNEPNASVPKENIDTLLSKIFPVLQKVAENFPEKWKSILPQYKICSES